METQLIKSNFLYNKKKIINLIVLDEKHLIPKAKLSFFFFLFALGEKSLNKSMSES